MVRSPRPERGRSDHRGLPKETGMALFVSLVLLLVLTLLGISAVQTTGLETRMARNDHDALLAFQAAESALREAETRLDTLTSTAFSKGRVDEVAQHQAGEAGVEFPSDVPQDHREGQQGEDVEPERGARPPASPPKRP